MLKEKSILNENIMETECSDNIFKLKSFQNSPINGDENPESEEAIIVNDEDQSSDGSLLQIFENKENFDKLLEEVADSENSADEQTEDDEVTKDDSDVSVQFAPVGIKRGRGRPRKNPEDLKKVKEKAKRGPRVKIYTSEIGAKYQRRGRPRIHPIKEKPKGSPGRPKVIRPDGEESPKKEKGPIGRPRIHPFVPKKPKGPRGRPRMLVSQKKVKVKGTRGRKPKELEQREKGPRGRPRLSYSPDSIRRRLEIMMEKKTQRLQLEVATELSESMDGSQNLENGSTHESDETSLKEPTPPPKEPTEIKVRGRPMVVFSAENYQRPPEPVPIFISPALFDNKVLKDRQNGITRPPPKQVTENPLNGLPTSQKKRGRKRKVDTSLPMEQKVPKKRGRKKKNIGIPVIINDVISLSSSSNSRMGTPNETDTDVNVESDQEDRTACATPTALNLLDEVSYYNTSADGNAIRPKFESYEFVQEEELQLVDAATPKEISIVISDSEDEQQEDDKSEEMETKMTPPLHTSVSRALPIFNNPDISISLLSDSDSD